MVRNCAATCLLLIGWKAREKELCQSWAIYDPWWTSHAKSLDWLGPEACQEQVVGHIWNQMRALRRWKSRSCFARVTWQGLEMSGARCAATDSGASGFHESRSTQRERFEAEQVHTDRSGGLTRSTGCDHRQSKSLMSECWAPKPAWAAWFVGETWCFYSWRFHLHLCWCWLWKHWWYWCQAEYRWWCSVVSSWSSVIKSPSWVRQNFCILNNTFEKTVWHILSTLCDVWLTFQLYQAHTSVS